MVIDILFCLLIGFNAVLGIKKGFIDAIFEFIDIGVGIFFAIFFYFDLTVFLSSFLYQYPRKMTKRLLSQNKKKWQRIFLFLFDGSLPFVAIDKFLGFLFGGLKTIILLTIFIWFFDTFISDKIYDILYSESQILVLLEPFKDYISKSMSSTMPI